MIDRSIPLVDLHRHLDGSIRPATIWELAQQHQIALPAESLQTLIPMTQIKDKTSDLLAFLQKLDYGVSVLADFDACYRVAYENMQDAAEGGLHYVELRFSPFYMAQAFSLDMSGLIEAVAQGIADGSRDFGVRAKLIGILSRTFGAENCMLELNALLDNKQHICGLDLAGDELNYPAQMFVEHFNTGRDAGWQITVHAGEADGPQSIWNAIELLGAKRIGHGVAAIQDDKLMDYLAENKIGIECCPTSNYQTATVTAIEQHPMATFLQKGMAVTLNTDDPGVSDIDLKHEYRVANLVMQMNAQALRQVQKNGVEQAFLSASEKRELYASL